MAAISWLEKPDPSDDRAWLSIPKGTRVDVVPFHINAECFMYLRSRIPQGLRGDASVEWNPSYDLPRHVIIKEERVEI